MQFNLDVASFKAAVDAIVPVINKRDTIPILSNIHVQADAAGLTLTGTDMDVTRTRRIALAYSPTAGTTTVPAHPLRDLLRSMPKAGRVSGALEYPDDLTPIALPLDDRTVHIIPEPKPTGLRLRSGQSNTVLSVTDPADYPLGGKREYTHAFAVPERAMRLALDKVKQAMSTEHTRYYLNGVYLDDTGDSLTFVATDGHRLCTYALRRPNIKGGSLPPMILPRKAVNMLTKALSAKGGTVAYIKASDTGLRVSLGGDTITTKLVDGTFPDYYRVIPSGNDKTLDTPADALAGAIKRVASISTDKARAVKLTLNGSVDVSASSPEHGTASERIEDARYSDDSELEVGFNSAYLTDMLRVTSGGHISVQLADSASPAIINDPGDPQFTGVLMPMRV